MSILIFVFLISFSLSYIFVPLAIKISYKLNLVKSAQDRQIPWLGGTAIYLAFIITIFLFRKMFILDTTFWGVIWGSLIIFLIGLRDDLRELKPIFKLIAQILPAIILIIYGVKTQIIFVSPVFNLLITFLWILGITNAFNLLDILDGLCAGLAIIIALTFFSLGLASSHYLVCLITISLLGASLGFLRYNLPPAKIFLGDSGSLFVGFVLAAIGIALSYAYPQHEIALFTPVLVLGVPIFDLGFVVLMRLKKKRSPLKKSKDHLALRYLSLGYSQKRVLYWMYLFGIFFSLCAILVSKLSNKMGLFVIALVIFVCFIITLKMSKIKMNA